MSNKPSQSGKTKSAKKRRVGRVTIYVRSKVWYLYYFENRQRVRRRVGPSLAEAKLLAAQVNAQLATGTPALLSFEPVSLAALRQRWLDHHEHVLRSSIATIKRYRTATDHLLRFVEKVQPVRSADRITTTAVEAFMRYLRTVEVAPNGHPNTPKRRLRDKGLVFILTSCRSMFNYAAKHRNLPPYHESPFTEIKIERIPIEDAKPVEPFTSEQETAFLTACDGWQFPIFLTLTLTGMRPGEATHLLLPGDVDLTQRVIRIRNKPDLGWRTKTRNQRDIPICQELAEVLSRVVDGRNTGPLFLRRRFMTGEDDPILVTSNNEQLAREIACRIENLRSTHVHEWTRFDDARVARTVWRDAGVVKEVTVRVEFTKVTSKIGLEHITCPKNLRHLCATCLQDAKVDPLIRQELMGHSPDRRNGNGLGMTSVYTHTRGHSTPVTVGSSDGCSCSCNRCSTPVVEKGIAWSQTGFSLRMPIRLR